MLTRVLTLLLLLGFALPPSRSLAAGNPYTAEPALAPLAFSQAVAVVTPPPC